MNLINFFSKGFSGRVVNVVILLPQDSLMWVCWSISTSNVNVSIYQRTVFHRLVSYVIPPCGLIVTTCWKFVDAEDKHQLPKATIFREDAIILLYIWFWFDFWCFNATFSNISAISWRPVLVVEEAGVPGENHRPWAGNR
jgi:hypothetical protein